jgi:hypothetical protein
VGVSALPPFSLEVGILLEEEDYYSLLYCPNWLRISTPKEHPPNADTYALNVHPRAAWIHLVPLFFRLKPYPGRLSQHAQRPPYILWPP